jgi:outer membrane protein OmpA-like peptidoglycan-associated protein
MPDRRSVMVPLLCAFMLSGCGVLGGDGGLGPETEDAEDGAEEAPPQGAGFVQEGYVGRLGNYFEARVEVTEVARLEDRTRTTLELTSLEDEPVGLNQDTFSVGGLIDRDITGFRLVDTVNQRRYNVYTNIGSRLSPGGDLVPGATYELVVYSPPLEGGVESVTVEAPGGLGEYAGIPVVEGEPKSYPEEPPEEPPQAGETITLPVAEGEPEELDAEYAELFGVVEDVVQGRETETDHETVALRADVLFEFDEAELTGEAENILDDVIAETRERADPDNPPIIISGHTDGIGDDDYNQELSEDRAESVLEVLEDSLGADYAYESVGFGSSQPVEAEGGDDDSWARAQNRRVEISYAFLDEAVTQTEVEAETEEGIVVPDPGDVGEPAEFRSHVGEEPVAEGEYLWQPRHLDTERAWTMNVYPFYRDGAYLVARFDVTHHGEHAGAGFFDPFSGTFGSFDFSVIDPQTGTIYREVRRGAPDERTRTLGPGHWPPARAPEETSYGYIYVPAPPEDVTSVTFDGGGFGSFPDIPIEG